MNKIWIFVLVCIFGTEMTLLISQKLLIGTEVINPRVWNSFGGARFGQTHVICTWGHFKISVLVIIILSGGSGWKIIHGPFVFSQIPIWKWMEGGHELLRSNSRVQVSNFSIFQKLWMGKLENLDPIIGFLTLPVFTVHCSHWGK